MNLNIFDFINEPLPIWKDKISIGEWFSGYGSQIQALKNIGMQISKSYIIEIDIDATIAYAAIHCDLNEKIKTFDFPSIEDIKKELKTKTLWLNEKQINVDRQKEFKLKQIYLSIYLSNNFNDVFKVNPERLPYVDLITWSSPCQDFSQAGKQKGFDGLKGGLTFRTIEVFKELKKLGKAPKFMLFENVPAIISAKFKDGFDAMRVEIERLGYENITMQLNAKGFCVPHNRDRVFILSIEEKYIRNKNYNIPYAKPLLLRLKDLLEERVAEDYYLTDKQINYILGNAVNKELKDVYDRSKALFNEDVAYTMTTKQDRRLGDANFIIDEIDEEISVKDYLAIKEATKKCYKEANDGDSVSLDQPNSETRRGRVGEQIANTLTTSCNQGVVVAEPICLNSKVNGKQPSVQDRIYSVDGISTALTTSFPVNYQLDNLRIRKLTELECNRLMGMSDESHYKRVEAGISSTQLYKQSGNSIVVPVLEAIFKELLGR